MTSAVAAEPARQVADGPAPPVYSTHLPDAAAPRSQAGASFPGGSLGTRGAARQSDAAFRRLERYSQLAGLPLIAVDIATAAVLARAGDALVILPVEVQQRLPFVADAEVLTLPQGLAFLIIRLPDVDFRRVAAVGFVPSRPAAEVPEVVLAALEQGWSQPRLDAWAAGQPQGDPRLVETLAAVVRRCVQLETEQTIVGGRLERLQEAMARTDAEIELLHTLSRNLQVSRSPVEVAGLCLRQTHAIVRSTGTAIWLEEQPGERRFVIEGHLPFDEDGLARLIARFDADRWTRPRIKNHIRGTLLGSDFPTLENVALVPIAAGERRRGWLIACNLPAGRPFGPVETGLLASVASILGTHLQNIELFREHEELILGFVRTLVSTLDAKDPYTRGHSERVARIARRLGQQLDLPEDDLRNLYLAGLLHDIGKIGVDDRILQKAGPLTHDECRRVRQHPMIGYTILQNIRGLRPILPGVRNHHESYDGKGYPDGLAGEGIPQMARILAVADAFDAMKSNRPYRTGLPLERVEHILDRGAGRQWDRRVVEAYFAARDEIVRMGSPDAEDDDTALLPPRRG